MFSIKQAVKYGWGKFRENVRLSLIATFLLVALGSIIGEKKLHTDTLILGVVLAVVFFILRIGYTKIFLRIYDGEKPEWSDIFKEYKPFWRYLGVSILMPLAVLGGLILLIIPGIILLVRLSFSPIIVIDAQTRPVAAMKESFAITKGFFFKLLLFWVVIGLINMVGVIALGVGLLVSIPVSTLAAIYVYREIRTGLTPSSASI